MDQWELQKSFFSYCNEHYLTNFGTYISRDVTLSEQNIPELYFNVALRRSVFTSLSLNTDPVLIILMLLFFLLILTTMNLLKTEYVIGTIASLFFTTIIAYSRFSAEVPVQYVVFLANFYQILEYIIALVTISTVSYCLKIHLPILHYRNMLIIQLLYWPLIMGVVLGISLVYFY